MRLVDWSFFHPSHGVHWLGTLHLFTQAMVELNFWIVELLLHFCQWHHLFQNVYCSWYLILWDPWNVLSFCKKLFHSIPTPEEKIKFNYQLLSVWLVFFIDWVGIDLRNLLSVQLIEIEVLSLSDYWLIRKLSVWLEVCKLNLFKYIEYISFFFGSRIFSLAVDKKQLLSVTEPHFMVFVGNEFSLRETSLHAWRCPSWIGVWVCTMNHELVNSVEILAPQKFYPVNPEIHCHSHSHPT